MAIEDLLRSQGVPDDVIDRARDAGDGALDSLAVEQVLGLGLRAYNRAGVAAAAGVDVSTAQRLWRAMGFADVSDDAVVFTDADVEMLRSVKTLVDDGISDLTSALQLARVMGQSLSRIADAQAQFLRRRIVEAMRQSGAGDDEVAEAVIALSGGLIPVLERFHSYVWRRHLAEASERAAVAWREPSGDEDVLAVGFADLVGFTSVSQELEDDELGRLIDRFETIAYEVVAASGGRIIKLIGDEVMFVASNVAAAARIALQLADRVGADESLPDVRVGLTFGPVVPREGDLFGTTVNRASRIVNVARPGSVVVDETVRDALGEGAAGLTFRSIRARNLRGIGRTHLYVLRESA